MKGQNLTVLNKAREVLICKDGSYVFIQESPILPMLVEFDTTKETHVFEGLNGKLIVSRELFKRLNHEFRIPNTLPFRQEEGDEI